MRPSAVVHHGMYSTAASLQSNRSRMSSINPHGGVPRPGDSGAIMVSSMTRLNNRSRDPEVAREKIASTRSTEKASRLPCATPARHVVAAAVSASLGVVYHTTLQENSTVAHKTPPL